jgi:hypothetical protein
MHTKTHNWRIKLYMKNIVKLVVIFELLTFVFCNEIDWLDQREILNIPFTNNTLKIVVNENTVNALYIKNEAYQDVYQIRSVDGGKTWADEVNLTNNDGTCSRATIVAQSDTLHLVYDEQQLGPLFRVMYLRSTDGGVTWDDEVELSPIAWLNGYRSPIVTNDGDKLYIIFIEHNSPTHYHLLAISLDRGETWEELVILNYPDINPGDLASLKFRNVSVINDVLHITGFHQSDEHTNMCAEIFYMRINEDLSCETPFYISYVDNLHSQFPNSMIDNNNTLHIVWMDYLDSPYSLNGPIHYKKLYEDNIWSNIEAITEPTAYIPKIQIDEESNIYLIYRDNRDGGFSYVYQEVYFRHYTVIDSSWGDETRLSYFDPPQAGAIALTLSENVIYVVWGQDIDPGGYSIYLRPGILNGLKGDVNGDTVIDIFDIIELEGIILTGSQSSLSLYDSWVADLNDDDIIDMLDIIMIINLILAE